MDVDVDTFFAKKDKKKKKKKYATTTDSLAKALETPDSSESDVKIDLPTVPTRDDEWKEEESGEKDLEGLKVQALRIDSEESGYKQQLEEGEEGREGEEEGGEFGKSSSVWQNVQPEATDSPAEPDPPPSDAKHSPPTQRAASEPEQPPQASGKYIPPSQRGGAVVSDKYVPPSQRYGGGRRAHVPPDIQSARAFPSLKASVEMTQKDPKSRPKDGADFKEVRSTRGSGRVGESRYEDRSGVELTNNRFSALGEQQSN